MNTWRRPKEIARNTIRPTTTSTSVNPLASLSPGLRRSLLPNPEPCPMTHHSPDPCTCPNWSVGRQPETHAGAAGVPPRGGLTSHGGGRYNGARRLRAFFVSSGGERSVKLGHPVRLLGVLLISVAAFLIAFEPVAFPGGPTTPRFQTPGLHLNLGLDLRGGSHIVLQAKATPETPISNDAMDGVLKVIRNRIDQLGVAEPVITRQGRDRIVAELPGIENPQRAIELIGKTALLEFVDTGSTSLPRGAAWTGPDTVVIAGHKTTANIPYNDILPGPEPF